MEGGCEGGELESFKVKINGRCEQFFEGMEVGNT